MKNVTYCKLKKLVLNVLAASLLKLISIRDFPMIITTMRFWEVLFKVISWPQNNHCTLQENLSKRAIFLKQGGQFIFCLSCNDPQGQNYIVVFNGIKEGKIMIVVVVVNKKGEKKNCCLKIEQGGRFWKVVVL